jgi:hypothetical protein
VTRGEAVAERRAGGAIVTGSGPMINSAYCAGLIGGVAQYASLLRPTALISIARSRSVSFAGNRRGGLNYLGICAGASFAGNSPYNGLNLTEGVRFPFYALENRNIRKAAVAIEVAGSATFDHYWEDGPELTGWGEPVAKYPDGTPAITQGTVGRGWVVLSEVHLRRQIAGAKG